MKHRIKVQQFFGQIQWVIEYVLIVRRFFQLVNLAFYIKNHRFLRTVWKTVGQTDIVSQTEPSIIKKEYHILWLFRKLYLDSPAITIPESLKEENRVYLQVFIIYLFSQWIYYYLDVAPDIHVFRCSNTRSGLK